MPSHHENTAFYVKVLDEYLEKGVNLLSEIFVHSTFPDDEIEKEKKIIREEFVNLVKDRYLSKNILAALGHSPQDPPEAIAREERSLVWKLTGVRDLVALKNL